MFSNEAPIFLYWVRIKNMEQGMNVHVGFHVPLFMHCVLKVLNEINRRVFGLSV
jgi:acetyltransferase-like isoleucine patch superfamily enzyme